MTFYPFDVTLEVCANGLLGFIGLLCLFALNREGIRPGFRLLPESAREWLIYYLHTLEVSTLVGLWICGIGHGRYIPWAFPVTLASFTLVLLSSLVIWRWDHRLCYRELLFCLVAFLLAGFAFPAINATREA
jgi:hypothetical protein